MLADGRVRPIVHATVPDARRRPRRTRQLEAGGVVGKLHRVVHLRVAD